MPRQHPVHDTVAALTQLQRMTVHITHTIAYRVTAPCLLQQLADAVGLGTETGGRGRPGSRPNIAVDALDLWQEVLHSTHGWAAHLDLDRRPYLAGSSTTAPAPAAPDRAHYQAPWWTQLDPDAADLVDPDRLPATGTPAPVRREQLTAPPPQLPAVGRLLRLVASTADSRGLDPVADAIHRSADRWRAQIEAMLHGQVEQRGVRSAECPNCAATTVAEDRDDGGRYRIPAIVLVTREVAGEQLQWLACQACGWSRGAGDMLHGAISRWLATLADCWRRQHSLLPPRRPAPPPTPARPTGQAGADRAVAELLADIKQELDRFPPPLPPADHLPAM